ncbi:MAG: hypothetical protein WD934_09600 [Gemmatimonadales bacterium]
MRGAVMVGALLLAIPAGAQRSGLTLTEPGSVRGAGLQGAGAALMGDAGSVFTNPAGLAIIPHLSIEASYYRVATDNALFAGALGWRLGQFDLGAGLKLLDYGGGAEYDALAVGSLIYRLGMLAFGGSAKVLREQTVTGRVQGVSGDIGVALAVFDILALGFAVQNVSGNWDETPLVMPRLSRLGFTMNYTDPQEAFRLLSTVEGQWSEGRGGRLVLGVEGGLVVGHAVGLIGRVAYGGRFDGSTTSRFTYGLTAELGWVLVDYALEPEDPLGSRGQRVGVRFML